MRYGESWLACRSFDVMACQKDLKAAVKLLIVSIGSQGRERLFNGLVSHDWRLGESSRCHFVENVCDLDYH